ncbi:hypothetical protein ABZ413_24455 [Nocardia rhamnosiphila]|uniref:hypothetical protein n=1 Tax=Nocardia rhamnosiphila TaxID=426716 RepID=UPI0033EDFAF9
MTETGTVQVDHQQFLLTAADTDTTDITAEGILIWTGPGFVSVLTGIAYGPVTLTVDTTTISSVSDSWEAVEETVIESGAELRVMTLDGEIAPAFGALPAGRYRVRVHARGRDTHTGLEVSEPAETYLLTVTPSTGPVGTVTTLIDTDTAHSQTSRMPVIDYDRVWVPGPDGGHIEVARDSPEAQAVYAGRDRWGGHPPTGRLAHDIELRVPASAVADLDRDLVDEILALSAPQQSRLARRCARWAFEQAGLAEIPDFSEALDALDHDRKRPRALANSSLAYHRLETDPTITLTVIPGFGGNSAVVPQAEALATYEYAGSPDPLRAAFEAIRFAAQTYGQLHPELISRIRTEFLDIHP